MSTQPLHLYDRSRTTTDWRCPRQRYWQYEYKGRGLVNPHTSLELFLGTTLHDGFATIATQQLVGGVDIDAIAAAAVEQVKTSILSASAGELEDQNFAAEQGALVEGLLRGFHKQVWSSLMAQYPKIVCFEQEMHYDHDGLRFMSKPDLVLADAEGTLWYVEYKSTSSKKEGWINSWSTAIQLHSSIRAIEATLGEKVTGVIVQGLYKGYESYGKQSSPFCYAYLRKGNSPFSSDEVSYEYKAGYKRYPTWELAGGVKKWVDEMPPAVLVEQFPQTPPILVKDELVDAFFRQRKAREMEIMLANQYIEIAGMEEGDPEGQWERVLDGAYPQRFDQCQPAWGSPCMYRRICHGHVQDPLNEGYEFRQPHHEEELRRFEGVD